MLSHREHPPPGVVHQLRADWQSPRWLPVGTELMDSAGVFFDAGIGQIVRDVIGDRLIVKFERW